ncbi:uncharacterized protein LY89DRAFT_678896 [Mollisia scopiformis]|uniref:Uncharacterized protein n=1 Tax=Mollisia scopiformis TaxID=149040 RepID=A0A132B3U8_MOLSC|nr:uncharacterized protein LY89DRAFT_678896 [Mollisia scopiformis]KUJ06347.1 hypothetical protein LY89DRAFT_678896 [Mollisia scopiformis]
MPTTTKPSNDIPIKSIEFDPPPPSLLTTAIQTIIFIFKHYKTGILLLNLFGAWAIYLASTSALDVSFFPCDPCATPSISTYLPDAIAQIAHARCAGARRYEAERRRKNEAWDRMLDLSYEVESCGSLHHAPSEQRRKGGFNITHLTTLYTTTQTSLDLLDLTETTELLPLNLGILLETTIPSYLTSLLTLRKEVLCALGSDLILTLKELQIHHSLTSSNSSSAMYKYALTTTRAFRSQFEETTSRTSTSLAKMISKLAEGETILSELETLLTLISDEISASQRRSSSVGEKVAQWYLGDSGSLSEWQKLYLRWEKAELVEAVFEVMHELKFAREAFEDFRVREGKGKEGGCGEVVDYEGWVGEVRWLIWAVREQENEIIDVMAGFEGGERRKVVKSARWPEG